MIPVCADAGSASHAHIKATANPTRQADLSNKALFTL